MKITKNITWTLPTTRKVKSSFSIESTEESCTKDGTFSNLTLKSNITSTLSFSNIITWTASSTDWFPYEVTPVDEDPGSYYEEETEGATGYYGTQQGSQWYRVDEVYYKYVHTNHQCTEHRNVQASTTATISSSNTIKIKQSASFTFTPIITESGSENQGGCFDSATQGSVIAYAKFTPSNTNIKVDNIDLASLCEPKEMSESLNFTAVDNGGNYHFPTNRDLSIFAKSIPGIPAITSGKLKNSGVDVNIAGLGERPIAEELCRIITPGTYSILRTDSSLTIGSNTYTASDFRDKVIPKVMGVLLVGGGGGGGGGSSSHSQGSGSGGGGGAITYGLIDFRQTNQAINVVIPNGGAYGVMDNNGIDGPSTYLAKNSSPILLAAGGKGGLCCQENTRKPGGAGGLASQSEFSVLPAIFVRAQDGGQGGSSCSGDESKPLSGPTMTYTTNNCWGNESFCNFSHESVCDTEGNTHSGGGGSGGASWGDGPRGSWNDHIGPDGTLGSGGSGGPRKALIGPQEHGSKGGDGLAIFYY